VRTRTPYAAPSGRNCTPGVLYELPAAALQLTLTGGVSLDVTGLLGSGRANYLLFQHLVATCTGWTGNSEGGDSDLALPDGRTAEVKAFHDQHTYPADTRAHTRIHTAASSTFGPNNNGPVVKRLLEAGQYTEALKVCTATGYAKNDFYVYTNTRGYTPGTPLRYLVVPTATVLANLSTDDPRIIDRAALLRLTRRTVPINPATLTRRP
jgi:hypothetical protein